jgi:hypothetical protein
MLLCGQNPPDTTSPSPMIFPPPVQAFEEVKQYLGLNDAQVQQLRQIMEQRDKATQDVYKQISDKYVELNRLLESGSTDVNHIGQLMVDIQALRKKVPLPGDAWRQQALAVLTAEQRTKLANLDQALKLSTSAYQAVTLNLLDPPAPGMPHIMSIDAMPPVAPLPHN